MNAKEKDEPVVVEKSAEVTSQKPIEVHGAPENISFKEIGDQIRASAEEALKNLDAIEAANVADVKDHVDEIAQTEMGEAKEHVKSAVQKNVPAWMPSFTDVKVGDQKTPVIQASGNPVAWAPLAKPTEDFPQGSTELDPVTAQKIKDALAGKPVMSNEVPSVSPSPEGDKIGAEIRARIEKRNENVGATKEDAKIEDLSAGPKEVIAQAQAAEVSPDEQAIQAAIDDLEAQIATKAAQAQLASNDNDMDKWSTILQEASVLHKQLDKKKEEMYALKREAWINNPATELTPVTSLTTEWQTGNERKVVELPPEDYGVVVKALENKMAEQVEAAPEQHNEDMVLVKKMQQLASDRGELTADIKEALQKEIGQKMNERVDGVLWQVIDEVNKKRPEGEKLSYDKTRDDFTGITKKAFLEAHAARKASLQDDIMVLKTYAENRSKDDPTFDDSEEGQKLMKHMDRLLADQVAYESINLNDLSISPSEVYKQASAGTEKVAPAANTAGEVAPVAEGEEAVFATKFAPVAERGNDPVPPTPLNEAGVMSPLDFLNNVDTSKAALYQNFPPQKKEGAEDEVLQSVPTGNTVQPAAHQTIGGTFRPGAPKPTEVSTAMPTEPLPGTGSTQLDAATQVKVDAALHQTNAMRFKEQQAVEAADKDAILEAEDRISWKVDQQLKASADMASIKSTENMTNAQKFAHEKEEAEKEGERTAVWQRQQAFNRKIEDIRNQAKTETDPEKRRALWGEIDNEIRVWEAGKQPKESVETLAANPAEEPIRRSAQIRQEALMNPNLTKDQFDAAMELAAEEEAKENAAAAIAATATAATVVPATPGVVETAVVENPVATEPVMPSTEPVPAGIPATEIPAPQPNIFEEEEAELRNQENRERYENMLAQPRKDLVDADISLREWFTGKDGNSPYRGKVNSLRNTWRSWTKSDKEYPDMVKVNGLVDAAMQKLIAQEKDTTLTDAQKKSLDTILNELKETSEFSGIQALDPKWDKTLGASMTRIKMAVEAKKKYTLARKDVLDSIMESKIGTLDVASAEFKEKSKEANKEIFESLVLGEYDAQTKLREEKLNGGPKKAAGVFRKSWDWYQQRGRLTKFGIGVVGGGSVVLLGSMAVSGVGAMSALGVGAYFGTRAVRAGLGMIGGRIGATVGDLVYSKAGIFGAWGEKRARAQAEKEGRAVTTEELAGNVAEKEWIPNADEGKEAFELLSQSYDQYAKIVATEQKLQRRRNIAKVVGGVVGGAGLNMFGYNATLAGGKALFGGLPDESTVRVNDPTMAELKNANIDGVQPGKSTEVGANIEGYHVAKGQGIWHGVKQQMKDYITAGKVKPEDLGLKTQEQLDALKLDLDDGKLDAANVRLLDRAIARSINANHMMNMGIKNIGETVTWKPNSTGGQIEFGSGDKALYQMGGQGSVVEHASQTSTSGAGTHEPILTPGDESKLTQSAEQIAAAKKAIAEQTGIGGAADQAGAAAMTEAAITQPKAQWYDQLSGTQRAQGEALFGDFKQRYSIDLNNGADGLNQAKIGDVYKLAKSWPDDGTNMPLKLTVEGVEQKVVITPELRRAILAVPPTEAEATMHFDNFMRAKVALKGSIDLAPKIESVVMQPTPEVKPGPTPIVEPTLQPKEVVQPTPVVKPGPTATPEITPQQQFERPAMIYRPPIGPQPTNVIKPIDFNQINIDQPPVPPTVQ